MVRTFVAIDLSPEIRGEIGKVQAELRQCRAKLTLVDPGIVHITIKFLGEVDEQRLAFVSRALQEVHLPPFTIDIAGIGVNNPRRPRVIWAQVCETGQCKTLNERVESALEPLGFAREERPFTAHATIARVREYDQSLEQAIRPHASRQFGQCRISGFSLKKSTLTPKGPVYETIEEVAW
jgi:RNA 2',3'-cyclic 3'-phosphodiesterase